MEKEKSRKEMFSPDSMGQKTNDKENVEFINPEYVALKSGEFQPFRIIGEPAHLSEKSNYSPHYYHRCMMKNDQGKYCVINYPHRKSNPDWILWKIITFLSEKEIYNGQEVDKYFSKKAHKNVIQGFQNWIPESGVVLQGIDVLDIAWHEEHKKFKILSKNLNDKGYYSFGISTVLYSKVRYDIVAGDFLAGDWQKYNIIFNKTGAGIDTDYHAYHPIHQKKEFNNDILSSIQFEKEDISDEIENWEKYNLDSMVRVSSYTKIKNQLGVQIQEIDHELGTKFFEELESKSDEEKDNWEKEKTSEESEEFEADFLSEDGDEDRLPF